MKITRGQVWLIVGIETFFFVLLAVWVLSRLDRLFEPTALAIAIVIVVLGDLVTVLIMQRYAISHITLAPGETQELSGQVISGFNRSSIGRVLVRGESWRAETKTPERLTPGDQVRIVARNGLTLLVEPSP